jgi:hypothetical protein
MQQVDVHVANALPAAAIQDPAPEHNDEDFILVTRAVVMDGKTLKHKVPIHDNYLPIIHQRVTRFVEETVTMNAGTH